jgi:hypothetical protein
MKIGKDMKAILTHLRTETARSIAYLLAAYRKQIEDEIYDLMRERLVKLADRPASKPATARKGTRGPRRCGKCGSLKHDARTHSDAKGKKATITVLKAAA